MDSALLANIAILVLAGFVGFAVISKVPNTLHTPLMSGTNAIHGIVLLGAIVVLGREEVGVVDVGAAGQQRGHDGEDLASRQRPADPAPELHGGVDQRVQPKSGDQRCGQQQSGCGDGVVVIEDHRDAVDVMDYRAHRKCLPLGLRSRR